MFFLYDEGGGNYFEFNTFMTRMTNYRSIIRMTNGNYCFLI